MEKRQSGSICLQGREKGGKEGGPSQQRQEKAWWSSMGLATDLGKQKSSRGSAQQGGALGVFRTRADRSSVPHTEGVKTRQSGPERHECDQVRRCPDHGGW